MADDDKRKSEKIVKLSLGGKTEVLIRLVFGATGACESVMAKLPGALPDGHGWLIFEDDRLSMLVADESKERHTAERHPWAHRLPWADLFERFSPLAEPLRQFVGDSLVLFDPNAVGPVLSLPYSWQDFSNSLLAPTKRRNKVMLPLADAPSMQVVNGSALLTGEQRIGLLLARHDLDQIVAPYVLYGYPEHNIIAGLHVNALGMIAASIVEAVGMERDDDVGPRLAWRLFAQPEIARRLHGLAIPDGIALPTISIFIDSSEPVQQT